MCRVCGLRHTSYNDAASDKVVLTMERYWGNYQAAYTFSSSQLQQAATGSAPSHRFQGNYFLRSPQSCWLSLFYRAGSRNDYAVGGAHCGCAELIADWPASVGTGLVARLRAVASRARG